MTNDPIDNKLGLQVVPPIRVEGEDIEALEESQVDETVTERERIAQVHNTLQAQNESLLRQLQLVGKSPTALGLLKLEHDVLLDFVFGEADEAREAYSTACQMQLNMSLKSVLGAHYGIEADPSETDEVDEGSDDDDDEPFLFDGSQAER